LDFFLRVFKFFASNSPTIGLIPANSTVKINIILHRHAEYPPEDPSGKSLIDKFQVQTMRIGAGTAADTLAQLVRHCLAIIPDF
jgi:transcriptional accessory protein Tex/SPT6